MPTGSQTQRSPPMSAACTMTGGHHENSAGKDLGGRRRQHCSGWYHREGPSIAAARSGAPALAPPFSGSAPQPPHHHQSLPPQHAQNIGTLQPQQRLQPMHAPAWPVAAGVWCAGYRRAYGTPRCQGLHERRRELGGVGGVVGPGQHFVRCGLPRTPRGGDAGKDIKDQRRGTVTLMVAYLSLVFSCFHW